MINIPDFSTKETITTCHNCKAKLTIRYPVSSKEEEADNLHKYIEKRYDELLELERVIKDKKQELKNL